MLMDFDVKPSVCGAYNEAEASLQFGTPKAVLLLIYTFTSPLIMEVTSREILESIGSSAKLVDASVVDGWLEKRFNFREQNDKIRAMGLMTDTAEVVCKRSEVLETYADVLTTLSSIDGVSGVGAHVSHLYNQGTCPTLPSSSTKRGPLLEFLERHGTYRGSSQRNLVPPSRSRNSECWSRPQSASEAASPAQGRRRSGGHDEPGRIHIEGSVRKRWIRA
jgi:hypothetical protein